MKNPISRFGGARRASAGLLVTVAPFLLAACSSAGTTGDTPVDDAGTAADGAPNPTRDGSVPGVDGNTPGIDGSTPGVDGNVPPVDGSTPKDGSTPPVDGSNPNDGAVPGFTTIFTILLENHDYAEIVGNTTQAKYINSLIASYGLATNYMDSLVHPSLPNYLYLVSGSTQGVSTDFDANKSGFTPFAGDNLGNQLQAKGIKWRTYQESMGTPCLLSTSGLYAPKHDGFLYFADIQSGAGNVCANTNVDYGSFAADLAGGTYRYMWITPNLVNDGHNGTVLGGLQASDTWLSTEVPKIMASTAYTSGGVIFITWDEAEGRNGAGSQDKIPMIIISPRIKSAGFTSSNAYSHASYLRTVETIFGLPFLGAAATSADMMEFFK